MSARPKPSLGADGVLAVARAALVVLRAAQAVRNARARAGVAEAAATLGAARARVAAREATAAAFAHAVAASAAAALGKRLTRRPSGKAAGARSAGAGSIAAGSDDEKREQRRNGQVADLHGGCSHRSLRKARPHRRVYQSLRTPFWIALSRLADDGELPRLLEAGLRSRSEPHPWGSGAAHPRSSWLMGCAKTDKRAASMSDPMPGPA